MIYVVIGTKAQLIKMAPVMLALRSAGTPYRFVSTGQHQETIDDILANFRLPGPDIQLYSGKDISSIPAMASWSLRILWQAIWRRHAVFGGSPKGIVLVHGDTFSTLLGAMMGRVTGLEVGHVESGLRSFNWRHPFPEEIIRLLTFRLSRHFFCPGSWAVGNLARYPGEKIDTVANTLVDALNLALASVDASQIVAAQEPFGVVSLHRFENIYTREALERVTTLVERIARKRRLLFVLHKPTTAKLRQFGLYDRLATNPQIELRPRTDYFSFIHLLAAAEFVVSDGGSNQEECYYLGKPLLLLREATERKEGLGENCLLSRYDSDLIEDFLSNVERYRYPPQRPVCSPSRAIADYCANLGS
jgi:UDP-N-acetylglucosamine 2-epimerase (non-hydrolysing)